MKISGKHIVIAVDGHSSCGKSTIAKQIADKLGIMYIDSGAMYRAATLYFMENIGLSGKPEDVEKIIAGLSEITISFSRDENGLQTLLNGKNVEKQIRQMSVSENVSFVATIPEVRAKLVDLQREMSKTQSVVMDGRDIGTVVFPTAEVKLFITAKTEVRAKRRFLELQRKGEKPDYQAVLENVISRDKIDSSRKVSPLKQASDAVLIDNSNLTIDEQLVLALNIINEKLQ